MLIIGSRALQRHACLPPNTTPKDFDAIATMAEINQWVRENKAKLKTFYPMNANHYYAFDGKTHHEFEIAWEGSNAEKILHYTGTEQFASPSMCLMLKMSHRYKKNSPFFLKTMRDIRWLRSLGVVIPDCMQELLADRERETYTYAHPNLKQKKGMFFNETVEYKYDHDDIHLAVKHLDRPAYAFFKHDQEEVYCDKSKFMECSEEIKLYSVLEESYVLAIERSLVPFDFKPAPHRAFDIALEKVCTSISSGWWREYAWEHYDDVVALYDESFVTKFKTALEEGKIKPHVSTSNSVY